MAAPPPADQFQERIARAKEAARLASAAATARSQPPLRPPPAAPFMPPPLGPRAFFPPAHAHAGPPPPAIFGAPPPPRPPPVGPSAPQMLPPDVQHRIDRLIEFIQRNGDAFEATVREREHANPEFAFLRPGAPFHDYFVWKKRQVCGNGGGLPPTPVSMSMPVPSAAVTAEDLLNAMSVGALANVCKLTKMNGLPPYAPLSHDHLRNPAVLPPVEPARLEIRIAEFYRDARK
uniref:SURP motif domain-containing protein n=1 Tax=Globisporangium ultimum (strain ATCC 200006 / CBS 805.95 / DAOM BR144) TaxID=431595 RepID=K3WWQ7_GLOUD